MKELELLAPARNAEIGIAAIDCGADAVYMAGDEFGARKDAGNSLEDVARVCDYAHKFGARVFLTVNTIIYDNELERAHQMMLKAQDVGVDAFIVQDLAVCTWDDIHIPIHASTQCAIREPQKALFYKSLGFSRLVLERETSLEQVKAVSDATGCELEYFVHGALCVCYSGQCYMSEKISGRSANRGACIQACRSLYDLSDSHGNTLIKNKALLSLKDYRLIHRLGDLANAGVCSFKIEGRLKNASYVKNVVREYSLALDEFIASHPDEYRRSSFGRISGGFLPATDKTFNRGYTELFLDGKRGKWSSMDAPKSMGEFIGTVKSVRRLDRMNMEISLIPSSKGLELRNGDGFAFAGKSSVTGFRGDVCEGMTIRCKNVDGVGKGVKLFRNINSVFEKELERNMPKREINIDLHLCISGEFNISINARSEDGREITSTFNCDCDIAENRDRQESLIREQLSKRSEHYCLKVQDIIVETSGKPLPLLSASILNSMRRLVASDIDTLPCKSFPMAEGSRNAETRVIEPDLSYKYNVANDRSRSVYESRGARTISPAYELTHPENAELMRTKYCIKHELGMCPVHQGGKEKGSLFLENNGQKFKLEFDCHNCEMIVKEG